MKYIIYDFMKVVLFPEFVSHADFDSMLRKDDRVFRKPTSAGFCKLENGGVKVFGRSTSLGLSPREDDIRMIEEFLRKTYE
jgi:hypothetical protein